jgi:hypothetical protein
MIYFRDTDSSVDFLGDNNNFHVELCYAAIRADLIELVRALATGATPL